jgi:DNA-directed RNA polymerase II subunit RPB1
MNEDVAERVVAIQFSKLTSDEIRAMSVCEITRAESLEGGKITQGGLLDYRMGSLEKNKKCQTCDAEITECMGHFGHLHLPLPVFDVEMLPHIVTILRCICFHCMRLLVNYTDPEFRKIMKRIKNPSVRLRALHKLCKKPARCSFIVNGEEDGCGEELQYLEIPSDAKSNNVRIECRFSKPYEAYNSKATFFLEPEQVLDILGKIPEKYYYALGLNSKFCNPESFIIRDLPVPPPIIRPSNMSNAASRGEDDLTYNLIDIARMSLKLQELIASKAPQSEIMNVRHVLQIYVASYASSSAVKQPALQARMGRKRKSMEDRLKGKAGRVRANLMGKRDDYVARAPISGDPYIKCNEVGIPQQIAQIVTKEEIVNTLNIRRLAETVARGPNGLNGANFVTREDGTKIDLRFTDPSKIVLKVGMKIERHLIDGDDCIMNRQPSLHRVSMMSHRARIIPGTKTIRLNESQTTPYNADFDGDEMNLHVQRGMLATVEANQLMAVESNYTTPQASRPVMSLVQDSRIGSYYLTWRDTFLDRGIVMQFMMWTGTGQDLKLPIPCILKPVPLWSGKQIFSMILPKNLNCTRFSQHHSKDEDITPDLESVSDEALAELVRKVKTSPVDANGVPKPRHELEQDVRSEQAKVHYMTPGDTRVFIRDGELLSGILCGKTVGSTAGSIIHIAANDYPREELVRFVDDAQAVAREFLMERSCSIGIENIMVKKGTKKQVDQVLQMAVEELENIRKDSTTEADFERRVNKLLNHARTKVCEDTMGSMKFGNTVKDMIVSSTKATAVNFAQMTRSIGQNNVEGKRMPFSYKNRCLPHFKKFDNGPEARGYIKENYMGGLKPWSFWWHAMCGREGLIDSAIKTGNIGYIQRRMIKVMEDLGVKYDHTVRNAVADIIQFSYGDDGFDAMFLELVSVGTLGLTKDATFVKKYHWTDAGAYENEMLQREWNRLVADRNLKYEELSHEGRFQLPANLPRIIESIPAKFRTGRKLAFADAPQVVADVFALQKDMWSFFPIHSVTWDSVFAVAVRCYLASKRVIGEFGMTAEGFRWVLDQVARKYRKAVAAPGEMVGPVAGTSLGEPGTQMTLRTFHLSGITEKNVTLGVPRLQELINASKKIKTPSLTVFLKKGLSGNRRVAEDLMRKLEQLPLSAVIENHGGEIGYDPPSQPTIFPEDAEVIRQATLLPESSACEDQELSSWVLRYKFDGIKLQKHRVTLASIVEKIRDLNGPRLLSFAYSDEYSKNCVLRIRINREEKDFGDNEHILLSQISDSILQNVRVGRVEGINRTFLVEREGEHIIETDGSNLAEVMGFDEVDFARTYCNDPHETMNVLGIEASRRVLFREINAVMSFDNGYVSPKHIMLLVDSMTVLGYLVSVSRHGMNKADKAGVLTMASFEETTKVFLNAARFGTKSDVTKGISESIYIGRAAPIGTNSIDVFLDANRLMNSECYVPDGPEELPVTQTPRFEFYADQQKSRFWAPSTPTHRPSFETAPPIFDYNATMPTDDIAPDADDYKPYAPDDDDDYAPRSPVSYEEEGEDEDLEPWRPSTPTLD